MPAITWKEKFDQYGQVVLEGSIDDDGVVHQYRRVVRYGNNPAGRADATLAAKAIITEELTRWYNARHP